VEEIDDDEEIRTRRSVKRHAFEFSKLFALSTLLAGFVDDARDSAAGNMIDVNNQPVVTKQRPKHQVEDEITEQF
jgi:hypothetical protein